jgi:hypothetical protein
LTKPVPVIVKLTVVPTCAILGTILVIIS